MLTGITLFRLVTESLLPVLVAVGFYGSKRKTGSAKSPMSGNRSSFMSMYKFLDEQERLTKKKLSSLKEAKLLTILRRMRILLS